MRVAVRIALPADAAAIAEVHVRAWQDGYRGLMPDGYLDGKTAELGARTERWRERLATPQATTTLVGLLDDEIVGIASIGPSRDHAKRPAREASGEQAASDQGELWMINVIGRAWGTGVGQALLDAAVERLRGAGFADAMLWVVAGNARARRFYERNGWQADGATHDKAEPGFVMHEVRYRIAL